MLMNCIINVQSIPIFSINNPRLMIIAKLALLAQYLHASEEEGDGSEEHADVAAEV